MAPSDAEEMMWIEPEGAAAIEPDVLFRRLRIIVVDDESLIAMALHDQLEYVGHEVLATVDNGPDAVALARELRPDLILMDVHLGGMDGLEAAERINRERPTPIVVLTGFPDAATMERGRDLGVVGRLVKPIDMEDLRMAVEAGYRRFASPSRDD